MLLHAWLELELVDGSELKIDQSFLQFNVKKKAYAKSYSSSSFYLGKIISKT